VLRERYLQLIDGKSALLDIIDDTDVAEHVYNSNAIENSTLSVEIAN